MPKKLLLASFTLVEKIFKIQTKKYKYTALYIYIFVQDHMGLDVRKPVMGGLLTTQAQTSLRIRTFVLHFLECIISRLATSEISISS